MPNMNVLINGTPGLTDGTPISEITFKNFVPYMVGNESDYSDTGSSSCAYIPLCLRMNSGYRGKGVTVAAVDFNLGSVHFPSVKYTSLPTTPGADYDNEDSQSYEVGTVENTNVLFFVRLEVDAGVDEIPLRDMLSISYIEEVV